MPEQVKLQMDQQLRQEQRLTPQLMQSMELLQMNSQELLEYLNRISEENPMLEQEDTSTLRSAYEELRQKAGYGDRSGGHVRPYRHQRLGSADQPRGCGHFRAVPASALYAYPCGDYPPGRSG